jgi:hypothetical protein
LAFLQRTRESERAALVARNLTVSGFHCRHGGRRHHGKSFAANKLRDPPTSFMKNIPQQIE